MPTSELNFRAKLQYHSLTATILFHHVSMKHAHDLTIGDIWIGQQTYRGSQQTKGMAMVPKRVVDVMACEIVRLLQLTQNAIIPISYHVQRKVSVLDLQHQEVFFSSLCSRIWSSMQIYTQILLAIFRQCPQKVGSKVPMTRCPPIITRDLATNV